MRRSRKGFLDVLHHRLGQSSEQPRASKYRIPAAWSCWGYDRARSLSKGEIAVDPFDFLDQLLHRVILPARAGRRLSGKSFSQIAGPSLGRRGKSINVKAQRGGDWIKQATIYGMLVRVSSAWDHTGRGSLRPGRWTNTGTFVKSILLLPLLRHMGINTLYLLPVTKCSRAFRKGELGCPYSAKNFFELEADLHDRLIGEDPSDVDTEFGAFVEAAHAMGIRVMVDLAPRTASRDSDLILEHPDWFYWIDRNVAGRYGPPVIEKFEGSIPRPAQLAPMFKQEALRRHLSWFREAPSVTQPDRWKRFAKQCAQKPPDNLMREIAKEFGVITPPGFSDCVNDTQPPWSDVTFLRLFRDHPAASVKHLPDPLTQAPYVFTDTIKASRFPGKKPNLSLWTLLSGILPFYQKFGIDGARVDMGHALPPDLQNMIIEKPRRKDPDFCFMAEEFSYEKAAAARKDGYNAILGASWYMQPRAAEGEFHRLCNEVLPAAKLPSLAAAETPDTPRSVTRSGQKRFARLAATLNHFLPGAVPFINSGMESFERQPLNLGLDTQPPGQFALKKSDPYHAKLGFFDRVALHWDNAGAVGMIELLHRVSLVRQEFLDDLQNPKNHFRPKVAMNQRKILALGWTVRRRRQALLVLANIDFKQRRRCVLAGLAKRIGGRTEGRSLFAIGKADDFMQLRHAGLDVMLEPGGVQVILV